ncbi:MAG: hypothetical protein D6746_13960 [Bacteroidetes bacterium]|nr:MAG: hypothetical protein D6746_13960 [Bacteroidota bacterium]
MMMFGGLRAAGETDSRPIRTAVASPEGGAKTIQVFRDGETDMLQACFTTMGVIALGTMFLCPALRKEQERVSPTGSHRWGMNSAPS